MEFICINLNFFESNGIYLNQLEFIEIKLNLFKLN